MRSAFALAMAGAALGLTLVRCGGGNEPAQVELPLVADGAGLSAFTNAEGYTIELAAFRVAVENFEFTVAGETHAGLWPRLKSLFVGRAEAHPGHYAGGEVTGELVGRFVIDAFAGSDTALGTATLLAGDYHGLNFTFRTADPGDGLAADDPLLGHTLVLSGTATRAGNGYAFTATLDIEAGTRMVGAPFTLAADADVNATLLFRVLMVDPSSEADSAFDGIDFAALAPPGPGPVVIQPGDAAHNVLKRRIQVHDHWWVGVR